MTNRTRKNGKDDYLFKRGNRWYVKLQLPKDAPPSVADLEPYCGQRTKVIALGTERYDEAEVAAAPYIDKHKIHLLFLRNLRTKGNSAVKRTRRWATGLHHDEDGLAFFATETEIIRLDANGRETEREPNPFDFRLSFADITREEASIAEALDRKNIDPNGSIIISPRADDNRKWERDDQWIETYINHGGRKRNGIGEEFAKEARAVWETYKELIGKPLMSATRADGRRFALHYLEEIGNKSATVDKKVGWLRNAMNHAIEEHNLNTVNPFSKVVPKREDETDRLPLCKEDMAKAREMLGELSGQDQLLWILLATTGMRLGEAFQICAETGEEEDFRTVWIGTKTEQSVRRIPLPTVVCERIPDRIKSRLFAGKPSSASKRLNRFITDTCGISEERKVLHSLRHRAKDRLRVIRVNGVRCGSDIQDAILGHNKKTVADGYGEGLPMAELAPFINEIGY